MLHGHISVTLMEFSNGNLTEFCEHDRNEWNSITVIELHYLC